MPQRSRKLPVMAFPPEKTSCPSIVKCFPSSAPFALKFTSYDPHLPLLCHFHNLSLLPSSLSFVMKLPCFIYSPDSRSAESLKGCVKEALQRCIEHERISPPDIREFWCSRAFRIVQWANKRWPNSEYNATPRLPSVSELDAETLFSDI